MPKEHTFDKTISDRIIEVVNESQAAQSEIATELGIAKSSVNSFMRGASLPNIASLYLLCKYLEIDTDYVLNLTDDKPVIKKKHYGRIYGVRPPVDDAISKRLADAINNSQYKKREIADAVGLDPVNISSYVTCACQPSLETLGKLCAFLDVSADDILGVKFYKLECEENKIYTETIKYKYEKLRDDVTRKIVDNLLNIIEKRDISNRKLAIDIEMQSIMFTKYKSGQAIPSPTTIQKICKYFNISSKEIFDFDI